MGQNRLNIGRHNWRHLGHNQDTRLTQTELIMTGKQEGPYMGEETKAEEDKVWQQSTLIRFLNTYDDYINYFPCSSLSLHSSLCANILTALKIHSHSDSSILDYLSLSEKCLSSHTYRTFLLFLSCLDVTLLYSSNACMCTFLGKFK